MVNKNGNSGPERRLNVRSILRVASVTFSFLAVWFMVAVVVGRITIALCPPFNPDGGQMWLPFGFGAKFSFGIGFNFPTSNGKIPVGIDLKWWNLPGTLIGGVVAFCFVLRPILKRRFKML